MTLKNKLYPIIENDLLTMPMADLIELQKYFTENIGLVQSYFIRRLNS